MSGSTPLLSHDVPRSDGQRDISTDESGSRTVLLIVIANVAFLGLVCSVLLGVPLAATPALFLTCSATLLLCVGPPLFLYLLCFCRLLSPNSILTIRAGHGAVAATPGLLLLGSTLPLLLLLIAVAIDSAGVRLTAVIPLLLLLLLPLGTSLHAARRLSVLHSKGMREQGFSGHGFARNLGDLVRKLAVVPAPLLAVAPPPLRRLLAEEQHGRENDHIGKDVLVTHSSTAPHAATNDAADGVGAATAATALARLLTLSVSTQVVLQLYAGVAARTAAVAGGVLPVVLPVTAWLLLLCAGVGAAARCGAHAAAFGALAAVRALPPRAVHRWWGLGLAELPTLLCAQMIGGVAVPFILMRGSDEAAEGGGGGGGGGVGGSWSAGWQVMSSALLLCYCVLASSLCMLSRRHMLIAAKLRGSGDAYSAMLQGAGAALTAAAAAAAKSPLPSLAEAAPNGSSSSSVAAAASAAAASSAAGAAMAAGGGGEGAGEAETPQLDEHALGEASPVVGGGLDLRHFTGGGPRGGEAADAVEWFVLRGGADADAATAADARDGPFTHDALLAMLAEGECGVGAEAAQCRVWHRGLTAWTAAGQVDELREACEAALAAAEPREQRVSLAAPAPPMLGGLSSSAVGKTPPKPLVKKKSGVLAGPPSMPGGVPRRLSRADPSSQQASVRDED